jgi:hypothetical protein
LICQPALVRLFLDLRHELDAVQLGVERCGFGKDAAITPFFLASEAGLTWWLNTENVLAFLLYHGQGIFLHFKLSLTWRQRNVSCPGNEQLWILMTVYFRYGFFGTRRTVGVTDVHVAISILFFP